MRTVLTGGRVFDGTGAPFADADVAFEGGRIVDVGPGLDGDEGVNVSGRSLLPGLFDCHIHVTGRYEDFDETLMLHRPFTYRFLLYQSILNQVLALGITTGVRWSRARAGEEDGWLGAGVIVALFYLIP